MSGWLFYLFRLCFQQQYGWFFGFSCDIEHTVYSTYAAFPLTAPTVVYLDREQNQMVWAGSLLPLSLTI